MQRRSFIFLLGCAAGSRSFVARAQQNERPRRVGVLLPAVTNDPQWQPRVEAFLKAFARLGWNIGGNVQIDTRWATADGRTGRRGARAGSGASGDRDPAGGHAIVPGGEPLELATDIKADQGRVATRPQERRGRGDEGLELNRARRPTPPLRFRMIV